MELARLTCCILLSSFLLQQVQSFTYESDITGLQAISVGWTSNLNWTGRDPCGTNWRGVKCDDTRKQNVTILNLSNAGLSGRLLGSIGNLENLLQLDLSFNTELRGELPRSLGRLVNLQYLTLQSCSFTGPIPMELGQLKNLKFLGLNMNQMTGSIPPELGGLSRCTWFDLSENNFSGELPVSTGPSGIGLDNLTAALHFHLNNNSFTGPVPKEITILPNLIHLLLDNNDMNGTIPEEFGNFQSLKILRLDNNNFEGPFPNISRVTTIEEIHIRNNRFTSLPDFSSLTSLMFISVGMNPYSPQTVPASLGRLTNLQTLEFDNANLVGQFPSDLLSLPAIESISMVANNLNSSVDLGNVSPSLALISANGNKIGGLSNQPANSLFKISLGGNPVCSSNSNLPAYVGCSSSEAISEEWTPSQGACTLKCTNKRVLNPALCSCAFPLLVRFQFNAPTFSTMNARRDQTLRGQLAAGVRLTEEQVWISKGVFTTENFRYIADSGFFPVKGVERFSDEESTFILSQFVFHRVNLTFDPYHAIVLNEGASAGGIGAGSSSGLKAGAIAGIAIGVVLLAAGLAVAVFYAVKQKSRADKAAEIQNPFASWGSGGVDNGEAPMIKGVKGFTVSELKKATNNFSESHEIGVGGYGRVYKGYLLTGETVAIKKAQPGSMQGALEFKTEIELLSRLHHKNLVGLVGFCYEHGEQMLVYEYMSNGTIQDHLFGNSKVLSWSKRLEIAVGSARAISYLHDLANPPIIHRDIKSTNILLDENFVAKVADFGLSKVSMVDEGKTHVSTQVKGTLGYLDPEYYMTQKLTDKSDVYSFGVVLLELVTARRPIVDGKYIVREMRNALARDDVWDLLDRSVNWHNARDLRSYLSLSMRCVDESAEARPTMNDVVRQLEVILANASSGSMKSDEFHAVNLYEKAPAAGEFEYSGGFDVSHTIHPKAFKGQADDRELVLLKLSTEEDFTHSPKPDPVEEKPGRKTKARAST